MDKNESFVAISDLHSNKEAMKKIYKYIDEGYKVVILGDVTDRGPYGDGTGGLDMLLEIKELSDSGKVIYIPGNHDELLYGYAISRNDDVAYSYADTISYNGGTATLADINQLRYEEPYKFKKLINWLGNLPIQRVYEVDGQKYCFAHALFNQKIYDTNPLFSLSDFYNLKDYNYNSRYAQIFWFRKYEDDYRKDELPSKDSIMIIGHTPQDNLEEDDFNLIDSNGDTIEVRNVDGGLAHGNYYMFKYDSTVGKVTDTEFAIPDNEDRVEDRLHINYKENPNKEKPKVNRSKSSKIRPGVIFDKFKNLEDLVAIGVYRAGLLKRKVSSKSKDAKDLKDRVVEAIKRPSKKMIAYILLATTLTASGIVLYSNVKPSGKKEIATTATTDVNTKSSNDDIEYVVVSGDTLSSIAYKYNVSVDELVSYNNIEDPDSISVGMTILIPSNKEVEFTKYIVKPGDTLLDIAINHNVDIETIIIDNNIEDANDIEAGTILKIRVSNNLESSIHKIRTRRI